jgi:transcriptional regulator with XRE-family HTH domain
MMLDQFQDDTSLLAEIGRRLARRRLDLGLTQAQLAREAGLAKRTVERIEAGASAQSASLLRVLRALELLAALDQVLPARGLRPMDLLRRRGKERRRARTKPAPKTSPGRPSWTWDDET